jgi:lipopolysaccharide transport system ATP-binding protein
VRTVIRASKLSKSYLIRHGGHEPYFALRDVFSNAVRGLGRRLGGRAPERATTEEFWALRDVSFDVKQGERLGIIGRNGAGKSTLLKLLSRITEPTGGTIHIKGRLASLLEVGTGFHPELTGRENIFLNGAILGMSKLEISRKFDAIVAFAEVERFLDTPVKRYSSGMYVRLAFAVAAHLEPDILVVDEVLAVGDAQFQKKCLGKMEDVSTREGRTVLFVGHNMAVIKQLCTRALLLQNGSTVADGPPAEVIDQYLQDSGSKGSTSSGFEQLLTTLPRDPTFQVERVELLQRGQPVEQTVENDQAIELAVTYRLRESTSGLRVYFDLFDDQGTLLVRSYHDETAAGIPTLAPGQYVSRAVIPANLLGPTAYDLVIGSTIYNVRHCLPSGPLRVRLHVENTAGTNRAYQILTFGAKLAPAVDWSVTKIA